MGLRSKVWIWTFFECPSRRFKKQIQVGYIQSSVTELQFLMATNCHRWSFGITTCDECASILETTWFLESVRMVGDSQWTCSLNICKLYNKSNDSNLKRHQLLGIFVWGPLEKSEPFKKVPLKWIEQELVQHTVSSIRSVCSHLVGWPYNSNGHNLQL